MYLHLKTIAFLCLAMSSSLAYASVAKVAEEVDSVTTVDVIKVVANPFESYSPEFDLKTNLLMDAVGTMSLSGEMKLSRNLSFDLGVAWNPWTFSDYTMYKQWQVSPELRWWPSQKGGLTDSDGIRHTALSEHFFGVHLIGGEFNYNNVRLPFNAVPSLKDYRYDGWMLGGGIGYGYRHNVSRHFAIEAEIGVGLLHTSYNKYNCNKCGERRGRGNHLYAGPTKAVLNLIWRIGANPRMPQKEIEREITTTVITRSITKSSPDTVLQQTVSNLATSVQDRVTNVADFELSLVFPLDSDIIDPTLGDNATQLQKLTEFVTSHTSDPTMPIHSIEVTGYSSVEGGCRHNQELSEKRAKSASALVYRDFPELRSLISTRGHGEDWESLQFDGKADIMKLRDLDEREDRLRRLNQGGVFEDLMKNQIPATRRVRFVIRFF